jgi:hypothetical protein
MRHLRKWRRLVLARKIKRGAVEVVLVRQFEADGIDTYVVTAVERDRLMIAFFDSAQIKRLIVLRRDYVAEAIDIKRRATSSDRVRRSTWLTRTTLNGGMWLGGRTGMAVYAADDARSRNVLRRNVISSIS